MPPTNGGSFKNSWERGLGFFVGGRKNSQADPGVEALGTGFAGTDRINGRIRCVAWLANLRFPIADGIHQGVQFVLRFQHVRDGSTDQVPAAGNSQAVGMLGTQVIAMRFGVRRQRSKNSS